MIPCPTCGKPVDPLRAPAVKVSEGKVVGFCSQDCKTAADTKPVKRVPTATPVGGVVIPRTARDADSGPVIEILHEPASGVVTSAADARSGRAQTNRRAQTDGAIQIADTGHLDDFVNPDEPAHGRRVIVVLVVLLAVVGGGAAAYYLGYLDRFLPARRDATAASAPQPVEAPRPAVVPADAPPTREEALARALAVLREHLASESVRVKRVAAAALARTGDRDAIEELAAALASDPTNLDVAYALARSGEKRGLDALLAATAGLKRDHKVDAGRRLAALGDKRAIGVLDEFLAVTQLRLGAAEQLAYFADPRAIKVLDEVRNDPKAVPDEHARAAIALGHAGRADVTPALHALLADDRNNAFAAAALVKLGDAAARDVLVKQLAIPSLRVQSARNLRRLAPDADVAPLLPDLLALVASKKDTEQVQVAEALLLLAGPPAWSERE